MANGIGKQGYSSPMLIVDLEFPSSNNYLGTPFTPIPLIFAKRGE